LNSYLIKNVNGYENVRDCAKRMLKGAKERGKEMA
jgi:hypothetical protein